MGDISDGVQAYFTMIIAIGIVVGVVIGAIVVGLFWLFS